MFPLDFGDAVAVVSEEGRASYDELKAQSDALASEAQANTVALVITANCLDCLVGYVGFLNRGVIPLMLTGSIPMSDIAEIISLYEPEYIYAPADHAVSQLDGYQSAAQQGSYVLSEAQEKSLKKPDIHLALLLSTSGSTGSQKFVRLSKENILANAESIIEYLGITSTERAITTLPLSYSYGLSIIHSHLLAGARIILTDKTFFDRSFWQVLKDEEATSFGGVPYTYEMLKQLRFARMDIPSLRYLTQAGGRLGPKLHKEFATLCNDKGIDFVVMYGQTEATARISYLPAAYAATKVDSIGRAIPGGEITLIADDGRVINEPHVPGELVYRGANVSLGYATKRDELALGDCNKGILHTGDIAEFDEDGMHYIVGRKERFLKIFGNRVNLDELEGHVRSKGFIAALAGQDDNCLVCLEASGAAATDESNQKQVLAELLAKTGLNKSAFKIVVVDGLPRNEAGKIQYAQLDGLLD